jgi:hypothetical protein
MYREKCGGLTLGSRRMCLWCANDWMVAGALGSRRAASFAASPRLRFERSLIGNRYCKRRVYFFFETSTLCCTLEITGSSLSQHLLRSAWTATRWRWLCESLLARRRSPRDAALKALGRARHPRSIPHVHQLHFSLQPPHQPPSITEPAARPLPSNTVAKV